MSENTKEKIAVRNNAGKKTPAATAPMANAYANNTVLEKIENLAATFRHRKCNETSSRFLFLNIKGNDKSYQTPDRALPKRRYDTNPCILVYPSMLSPEDRSEPISCFPPFECKFWFPQKATKEFYDTAGGIDNIFIQKSRHPTQTSIDVAVPTSVDVAVPTSVARQPEFGRRAYDLYGSRKLYLEEKDENIRRLLERASRDEPSYICLPEHANLFTQTKLLPEIYTKDEITEMFYGVCGEDEKNKEAFQMKLDGVYYPLNDSVSWLTTCMEEMKQDIARIQHATDVARPPSIDRRRPPSIDRQHHTSINNHMSASINDSPERR
ncbi:hypothetical protein DY000_02047840 [Brassica cretica]|uniref:Uncharacterized protein n=1 Tax=Brassica cretica TaxID=69181 RepID=A0ABQ7ETV4_BRACR|nr:hypothetical protein DY000_02047840 [Brassica cretica]